MAVFEAYFDESERPGGTFCVAGYVFTPKQAEKFSTEWRRLMAPYWPFHMKELAHGRDHLERPTKFETISQEQRDRLLQRAVDLINRRITLSISISCNAEDVRRLNLGLRNFTHAYSLCCYAAMNLLAQWIERRGLDDRVAYVFEAGHRFQAEADRLLRPAGMHPALSEQARYESHAFVRKEHSAGLQAADLYAWELGKFLDETVGRQIRPPRASLKALIRPDPKRYVGRVLRKDQLRKYFAMLQDLEESRAREWQAIEERLRGSL
jgi:hypothetical protein